MTQTATLKLGTTTARIELTPMETGALSASYNGQDLGLLASYAGSIDTPIRDSRIKNRRSATLWMVTPAGGQRSQFGYRTRPDALRALLRAAGIRTW